MNSHQSHALWQDALKCHLAYHIQNGKSMKSVPNIRKSVSCTNTKLSLYTIFHLEKRKNWWYYIATKKNTNEQENQKQQDQKALDLKFLSVNEKQSHEIPLKRISINCMFENENRRKAQSDQSLKTWTKGNFLKDSKNYLPIFLSRRAKEYQNMWWLSESSDDSNDKNLSDL